MSRCVRDIMSSNVVTIAPHDLLSEAYHLLRDKRISILVVKQAGKAIGLITERDVVRFIHDNIEIHNTSVADVMTSPIMTVQQNCSLFEAYAILTENHFRHLVVHDDAGMLAGVITLTDMLGGMGMEYFVDLKQVANIMAKNLVSVRPCDPLRLVVDLMHRHLISCVIVVQQWKPVGIITERDIVNYHDQAMHSSEIAVSTVMSSPVRTMTDDSYIPEVNRVMSEEKLRHMVVVDRHGCLSGLISQTNLTACMEAGYVNYLKTVIEQREKKLSALRHEHDAFLQKNPNAVLAFDLTGEMTDANPAGLRLLGIDAIVLKDMRFEDVIHPDSLNQAMSLFEESSRGHARNAELNMRSLSGNLMHTFSSFVPVKETDKVTRIYAVIHDITEKKIAEQHLFQSEQRFQALVELSRAMPWALNLSSNRFSYVGKQFKQHLGYLLESWINMDTWLARVHADDRQEVLKRCATATESGDEQQFCCRMIAQDGHLVSVQNHISILMQAGCPIEMRGFMFLMENEREEG